jgi:hypothetical protein
MGVGWAGVAGGSKEGSSTAGWATAGRTIIGEASGSTENAGDFADRDDRRLDFFGSATNTAAS